MTERSCSKASPKTFCLWLKHAYQISDKNKLKLPFDYFLRQKNEDKFPDFKKTLDWKCYKGTDEER